MVHEDFMTTIIIISLMSLVTVAFLVGCYVQRMGKRPLFGRPIFRAKSPRKGR